jgi:hypothetical protein
VTPEQGVLDRPASSALATGAAVRVPVAETSPRGATRGHYLWASGRFAAIALLTAVVTLWLLDWVLFDTPALAPHLRVVDDPSPAEKLLLAVRYPDAQVLYLGDSRVLVGVDPSVVSETCGCGPGYNAAFAGADTRLSKITGDRLLGKLSPRLVVIGVSQWELSDRAGIRVKRPAMQLLAPWELDDFGLQVDQAERVQATIGAASRLYRSRRAVREALDPSTWTAPPEHEPRRGFYGRDGGRELGEDGFEERKDQYFSDFSVRGRRAEALRALLTDVHGRGVRVLLVALPLHPKLHGRVRQEVGAFRTAMEQLAVDTGAPFEDLTAPRRMGLDSDHFLDPVHIDKEGAATFSRHLGRVIRARLHAG